MNINENFSYRLGSTTVNKFHQDLVKIESFSKIPDDFNRWPSVKIEDTLARRPDQLEQFMRLVEEFGRTIKKSATL